MSVYRQDVRVALKAALAGAPVPVFSNPPANEQPEIILIGDIIAEPPEVDDGPSAYHTATLEIWLQTFSPARVDSVADWICGQLEGGRLLLNGRRFGPTRRIGEQALGGDPETGGPVFGRALTFRFLVS